MLFVGRIDYFIFRLRLTLRLRLFFPRPESHPRSLKPITLTSKNRFLIRLRLRLRLLFPRSAIGSRMKCYSGLAVEVYPITKIYCSETSLWVVMELMSPIICMFPTVMYIFCNQSALVEPKKLVWGVGWLKRPPSFRVPFDKGDLLL